MIYITFLTFSFYIGLFCSGMKNVELQMMTSSTCFLIMTKYYPIMKTYIKLNKYILLYKEENFIFLIFFNIFYFLFTS